MRICMAQSRPVKGNIESNIVHHTRLIELALAQDSDLIIFPELSLTGYEPELAESLAMSADDVRLTVFQKLSDRHDVSIGIGIPLKRASGIEICMVIFHPQNARQVYSKQFLHVDEEAFFIPGPKTNGLLANSEDIALAICYEITIPEHVAGAAQNKANHYIASVVKSTNGVERAINRLSEIARKYGMNTFLSNCVGESEDYINGGKSSVWGSNGKLLGQLDQESAGVLIFDTNSKEVVAEVLN